MGRKASRSIDLLLQFPQDQRRAPAQHRLADVDVGVQVVAHVEDLVARQPQVLFHLGGAAPEVDPARLQFAAVGAHQPLLLVGDAVQRAALGEEARLIGAHDDQVEKVAPLHARGQPGIEGDLHEAPGVVPVGVGDQHQPLAGVALVEQGGGRLRVGLQEAPRLGQDLLLERAGKVGLVHRGPQHPVELGVGHHRAQAAGVEKVDQLGVEGGLGQGEEGVQEDEARVGRVYDDPGVGGALLFELQEPGAVGGPDHVAETGRLDQVARLQVDGESPDHPGRVEVEALHRPAAPGEEALGVVVGPPLPLPRCGTGPGCSPCRSRSPGCGAGSASGCRRGGGGGG